MVQLTREGDKLVLSQTRTAFRWFFGIFLVVGVVGGGALGSVDAGSRPGGARQPDRGFLVMMSSVGCAVLFVAFRSWSQEIQTEVDRRQGVLRSTRRMWLSRRAHVERPLSDLVAVLVTTSRGSRGGVTTSLWARFRDGQALLLCAPYGGTPASVEPYGAEIRSFVGPAVTG